MNARSWIVLSLAAFVLGFPLWLAAAPPAANKPQPAPSAPAPQKTGGTPAPTRHALLVGCTKYEYLPGHDLEGPANDVALMQELLGERFGFPAPQIVVLAEGRGAKFRPTRENIEHQFQRLANVVQQGDRVVISMSGHGTQQPDSNPPDPLDPEPDGLDEVFLPADAQPFDRKTRTIPHGIVDDELGVWVRRIRDQGAYVWITVDSCHSGTITRGSSDDVERRVPPESIIPKEELTAAQERAAGQAGGSFDLPLAGDQHHIVALYAAQPQQSTIELPLPLDAAQPRQYGLLTFMLSKVLTQARSTLTYRELAQQIQAEYVQAGRSNPTPLLEGGDCDREVLGLKTWPGRSRMTLSKKPTWRVNSGALHGLTVGSILQVCPPAGEQNPEKILGHVRVKRVASTSCDVEPCEHAKWPIESNLPERARCELVYLDYRLHKLHVAVDLKTPALRDSAAKAIAEISEHDGLVELVSDVKLADWILREAQGKLALEPACGFDGRDAKSTGRIDQFVFRRSDPGAWLQDPLRQIARGQNLLRMVRASATERRAGGTLDVTTELLRLADQNDREGEPVAWQEQGIVFHPGDVLACRLKNNGRLAADVTLLFVDSGFGIKAIFPGKQIVDNKIAAGESLVVYLGTVNGTTLGLEHLVMIAVPSRKDVPIDFSALEQPTLEQARGTDSDQRGLNSPLGLLMSTALYAHDGPRGMTTDDIDQQSLALISWRVSDTPVGSVQP